MSSVIGTVRVGLVFSIEKTQGRAKVSGSLPFGVETMLSAGSGAGQINLAWWGRRDLAPGASEKLALDGGLVDALGEEAAFSAVKGIYIATNRGLAFDGSVLTDAPFPLSAGDVFMTTNFAAGWPVEAGAAVEIFNRDLEQVASYDIAIIGIS